MVVETKGFFKDLARKKLLECRQYRHLCSRRLITSFLDLERLIIIHNLSHEDAGTNRDEFIFLRNIVNGRAEELKIKIKGGLNWKCRGEDCICFPEKKEKE